MPFLQVNMLDGRDEQVKAKLIRALTNTVCEVLGSEPEQVRVQLIEVPTTDWGVGGKTAKELGRSSPKYVSA